MNPVGYVFQHLFRDGLFDLAILSGQACLTVLEEVVQVVVHFPSAVRFSTKGIFCMPAPEFSVYFARWIK